ncbi:MAG: DUF4013 domain-containing protein [Candidatus Nanoarchaeia archaeon]|nr:DUF4013 domain-containing protein [Candidatus Nanoarchaeia archaeon]
MVNYNESIKRPFTDLKNFLIGVVLSIIPIINIFVMGYELECAKSMLKKGKKDYKLPEWKDWGNLFVRGLLSIIISIIWAIPLFIALIVVIGNMLFPFMKSLMTGIIDPTIVLPTLGIGILVISIIALLTAYIAPMAIVNYATDYKFGSGFEFNKIFKKAFTGKYLIVWILALLLAFVITLILSIIPLIGSAISSFIAGVITYTLFGEVFSEID